MPDIYATISEQPQEVQELVVEAMRLRADEPEMQAMLDQYLSALEIPKGAKVLEIGCGAGPATRKIAELPSVSKVTALDPSPVFLERARQDLADLTNVEFLEGDARSLQLEDGSFEVVIAHTVLCHVPEPEKALQEAYRALVPGGEIVIFDGDYATTNIAIGDFVTLEVQKLSLNPSFGSDLQTYEFISRDVRRLLKGDICRKQFSSTLVNILTSPQTVVVDVSDGFIDPTNLASHFDGTLGEDTDTAYFILLGDVMRYDSKDDASEHLINAEHNSRGRVVNAITDYAVAGEIVKQTFGFKNLYPTEALLHILLTTDDGSGHAFYDLATMDAGYGGMGFEDIIDQANVDIEGIERLGWKFFNHGVENCMGIALTERTNGLEWIIKNILKPAGLYMYIRDGKISVKSIDRLDFLETFTIDQALTKNDIVNKRISSFEIDIENLINEVAFSWDIEGVTGTTNRVQSWHFKNDDSVTQYGGREKPFQIENPLVTLDDDVRQPANIWQHPTDTWEDQVRDVIVQRWLFGFGHNPFGKLDVNLTPDKWLLQATDKVSITHDKIPDINDGTRGWSAKPFFILGQKLDPIGSPPQNTYQMMTHEAITKVSDPFSFTTIAEGSITDTSITHDADNTVTEQVADGNHDFASPFIAQSDMRVIILKIEIDPPGSGSTHHWVKFGIKLIDQVLTSILFEQNYRAIRYLSSDDAVFTLEFVLFPIYNAGVGSLVRRVKVDMYEKSATGAEELSAVTIKEIKYSGFVHNLSTVKELG